MLGAEGAGAVMQGLRVPRRGSRCTGAWVHTLCNVLAPCCQPPAAAPSTSGGGVRRVQSWQGGVVWGELVSVVLPECARGLWLALRAPLHLGVVAQPHTAAGHSGHVRIVWGAPARGCMAARTALATQELIGGCRRRTNAIREADSSKTTTHGRKTLLGAPPPPPRSRTRHIALSHCDESKQPP